MNHAPADKCLTPQSFWRSLERHGLSPAAVLKRAGLPASLHLNPEGYVSTAEVFAIWKAVEALTGDAGFGLALARGEDTAARKPALLAAYYAATYRDALARLAGFKRFGTCFELRFEERGDRFAVTKDWLFAREPEPALSADAGFAALLELGRKGTGRHIVPIRMEFARPDPGSDVHRAFFGCEVRYGAPANRLVLRSADVDLPFPGHNPELLGLLAPALTAPPDVFQAAAGVGERVRNVLKRSLAGGRPEVADVARDLVMSARTLQRRITEEGETFRGLLAQARRERVRELLSDPALAIDQVAAQVGYRSTPAFFRAFRDWEGMTPAQWRSRNGAEDNRPAVPAAP